MRPTLLQSGVTLIELMVVIASTAILLAIGVPAFLDTIDLNRLKAAAESLYADMQYAKSEAVKQNKNIHLVVTASASPWNHYLTETYPCTLGTNCTVGGVSKVIYGNDYPGVTIATNKTDFEFDSVRHTLATTIGGTVTFTSAKQKVIKVTVSAMGRIRTCSPSGTQNVAGYSTSCP